jgi:hypothetical protein
MGKEDLKELEWEWRFAQERRSLEWEREAPRSFIPSRISRAVLAGLIVCLPWCSSSSSSSPAFQLTMAFILRLLLTTLAIALAISPVSSLGCIVGGHEEANVNHKEVVGLVLKF